ncbi:TerB N-terminal domain-containing protein [Paraglaciecola mesophila]|uniref:TerB N-terminal domain-containing protein n=1 Tax=Paraglaciecola mesophila TaxID=197222 RepID=A0ABU9SW60_9ALTE
MEVFYVFIVLFVIWLIGKPKKEKREVKSNSEHNEKSSNLQKANNQSILEENDGAVCSPISVEGLGGRTVKKDTLCSGEGERKNIARNNSPLETSKQTVAPKKALESLASQLESQSKINTTSRIENASSSSSFDDDLASFDIFENSKSQSDFVKLGKMGIWIGKYQEAIVQGRKLRGFLYVGERMESLRGYMQEPALVNSSIPAVKPSINTTSFYTDETLGYWPSYDSLSKECRGSYLDWLGTDKSAKNTPIGFVFLYFNGLERFVIENSKDIEAKSIHFEHIYDEVLRLNKEFDSNRSFFNYSANFLELLYLLNPVLFATKKNKLPPTRHSLLFKSRLAEQIVSTQKVDEILALEWIKNTEHYTLRTAARRCDVEFGSLFKLYFKQKFPEGMAVKPNKTKLNAEYYPANNGIPTVKITLEGLPDPSILKGPVNKLVPLADKATEELASYSRYLGKADTSKDDLAALMLLPSAIANIQPSPLVEKFKSWAQTVITEKGGVTDVAEFWLQTGLPTPKTINKKESELIYSLANFANVGIAPDSRYHHAKLKVDGKIALFSPCHENGFIPSHTFNQVGVALRLGAMVASIDGFVDEAESSELQKLISHDEKLADTEKRSLQAYLTWRLATPSDNTGLKNRLSSLGAKEIEFVKRFIISVALADGNVDNKEVKQIEKLYTNLGLDKDTVSSDIHQLTTSSHQSVSGRERSSEFSIDEAILALHESQTTEAKSMLEEIFTSEEDDESESLEVAESSNDINGLDQAHSQLYEKLCTQAQWSRNEVARICGDLNLMIDGAIETINDWAFDLVDAPVIEDDGEIYIDEEIVEEIREL